MNEEKLIKHPITGDYLGDSEVKMIEDAYKEHCEMNGCDPGLNNFVKDVWFKDEIANKKIEQQQQLKNKIQSKKEIQDEEEDDEDDDEGEKVTSTKILKSKYVSENELKKANSTVDIKEEKKKIIDESLEDIINGLEIGTDGIPILESKKTINSMKEISESMKKINTDVKKKKFVISFENEEIPTITKTNINQFIEKNDKPKNSKLGKKVVKKSDKSKNSKLEKEVVEKKEEKISLEESLEDVNDDLNVKFQDMGIFDKSGYVISLKFISKFLNDRTKNPFEGKNEFLELKSEMEDIVKSISKNNGKLNGKTLNVSGNGLFDVEKLSQLDQKNCVKFIHAADIFINRDGQDLPSLSKQFQKINKHFFSSKDKTGKFALEYFEELKDKYSVELFKQTSFREENIRNLSSNQQMMLIETENFKLLKPIQELFGNEKTGLFRDLVTKLLSSVETITKSINNYKALFKLSYAIFSSFITFLESNDKETYSIRKDEIMSKILEYIKKDFENFKVRNSDTLIESKQESQIKDEEHELNFIDSVMNSAEKEFSISFRSIFLSSERNFKDELKEMITKQSEGGYLGYTSEDKFYKNYSNTIINKIAYSNAKKSTETQKSLEQFNTDLKINMIFILLTFASFLAQESYSVVMNSNELYNKIPFNEIATTNIKFILDMIEKI